jgi:tetratricopeptide (TPR) repeat protein
MAKESWIGKATTARVAGDAFYYVDSPAEPAVDRMENTDDVRNKVIASWVALNLDPGCIEAHVFRGIYAKDPELRLLHLKAAVATGETLWGPVADEEGERMTWWGFTATRPYMRAIQALGMEYMNRGEEQEAAECFRKLLEMNPYDNQRIGDLLAQVDLGAPSPRM